MVLLVPVAVDDPDDAESVVEPVVDATAAVPLEDWLVEEAAELDPEAQLTASGTVTPAVVQSCWAYLSADAWSAASQALARQQAMLLRNSCELQIHLMSRLLQLPMLLPLVKPLTQVCYKRYLVAISIITRAT